MIDKFKKISRGQWKTLCSKTHTNCYMFLTLIEHHIGTVEDPIDNNMAFTTAILLALYTFAIEEHGKFLYLISLKLDDNDEIVIEYREKFRNHNFKTNKALSTLPAEFTRFPSHPKASFSLIEPDLETRLNIFYTDIDENGDATNVVFNADIHYLRIITWNFHNYLLKFITNNPF